MSVRAKFKVNRIERMSWGPGKEVQTIVLLPVTDGTPEDKAFFAATPSGEIRLGTVNAAAAAEFDLNAVFYVDFTRAEPT